MNYVKTAALLAFLTALFMGVGWMIGGAPGMAIAFMVALATNAWAWWSSDKAVLHRYGAQPVTRASAPEFHALMAELSRNAGLPMPKIYIIDEAQPNAFATGRSPENAAVAATTGLLRSLSREELAGVMAHELAHIRNRDTLIMTIAATMGGAISMLAQFGMFFGGGRNRDNPMGFVGVLIAALLAPMIAMLIQMLISRTREYAADREGARICRNPLWLASALQKIGGGGRATPMQRAERDPASAHMFIVNPLSGRGVDSLFSTHPKMENRIAALLEMAKSAPGDGRGLDSVRRTREQPTGVPRSGAPRARRKGPWS